MQILFTGLPFVTTFVDDIVVYSKTLAEHQAHVRIVLERLTKANLVLNPDKCHFAQKAVYLLGFRVSAAGRALDSRKVTNVLEWPSPRTGKDIQRFLGVVNYFRDHIPNVSRLTARLDALRHAGELKQAWTSEHENDFGKIKYAVSHAPTLRHVNLKLPFHLATDASNDGIGAVLYQKEKGRNNIVGFMARALTKSERNY
jgi:putative transposase